MAFTPEQKREYRKKLKAEGRCVVCYKPHDASKAKCAACVENFRKYRTERAKEGACYKCLRPVHPDYVPGGCGPCLEKQRLDDMIRRGARNG